MVPVRVTLSNLWDLRQLYCLHNFHLYLDSIDMVIDSPVDEICPHLNGLFQIELTGA